MRSKGLVAVFCSQGGYERKRAEQKSVRSEFRKEASQRAATEIEQYKELYLPLIHTAISLPTPTSRGVTSNTNDDMTTRFCHLLRVVAFVPWQSYPPNHHTPCDGSRLKSKEVQVLLASFQPSWSPWSVTLSPTTRSSRAISSKSVVFTVNILDVCEREKKCHFCDVMTRHARSRHLARRHEEVYAAHSYKCRLTS